MAELRNRTEERSAAHVFQGEDFVVAISQTAPRRAWVASRLCLREGLCPGAGGALPRLVSEYRLIFALSAVLLLDLIAGPAGLTCPVDAP